MFNKKKSLLIGISGGIAAYKVCEIIRHFVKLDVTVQTVVTKNAEKFITKTTLSALSGRQCFSDMFDNIDLQTENGNFKHIDLARDFDVFLVAPATANVIGKFANGIADDLLTTTYLSFDKPIIVAPAMNTRMWQHKATVRNIDLLRSDGVNLVGPVEGTLACGEAGTGKLADVEAITACTEMLLGSDGPWAGKRVLVTTGATRESIDPVRFVSNNSTGEFGNAIARQLVRYGAKVSLIEANPAKLSTPSYVDYSSVSTAREMLDAVIKSAVDCDFVFMLAAVADYTPTTKHDSKLKKSDSCDLLTIELTRSRDVLHELSGISNRPILVGVSAETDNVIENSRLKLERKNLHAILAVDVGSENRPFGAVPITSTLIFNDNTSISLPLMNKDVLARVCIDEIHKRVIGI